MSSKTRISVLAAALLLAALSAAGQMTPWFQWSFLAPSTMDLIAGEASGEAATGHIVALGTAPRDRKHAEYAGTFLESQYVFDRLKEYGLKDAEIIRFPGGETWDGVAGELWEIKPGLQKIASYTDLRAMLVQGSTSADVTADLVWAGDGTPKDFEGLDVKGKIVVTSGSAGAVHNLACQQKEAAGVISFDSPRPLVDPLLMPWGGLSGTKDRPAKFAFALPPREGVILRDRLKRGEKITVRARVEAATERYEQQMVAASILGASPDADEVILSAHLFEGLVKQDANDNFSGCAALLESARLIQALVLDGRLAPPKRAIRFLWAPEIGGTAVYVKARPAQMQRTLCDINLDMVGVRLTRSLAFFTVMRTTYGNPHYVNDVLENVFRYVGETNRSYVTNGMSGGFAKRIVAPSGSEEPMYYYVGTHFGSSDHEVFNDWGVGVPGVVLNTWPDQWYHTSQDRPDKIDPTQMKRAVTITAAAAYIIAAADDRTAGQIAAEIVSNASGRIGHQLARGVEEMKRADKDGLAPAYKKVRGYVEAAAINERATLDSVRQLAMDKAVFGKYLDGQKAVVAGIEQAALKALDNAAKLTAGLLGTTLPDPKPSDLEKRAAGIVPRPTPKVKEGGYQGYQALIQEAQRRAGTGLPSAAAKPGTPAAPAAVRGARGMTGEIQLLCDGRNSALDIKKMLDTQFRQETELEAVLAHLDTLKAAGLVVY